MKDGELQLLSKYRRWSDMSQLDKTVVMEKRIVFVRWLGIIFGAGATPFLHFRDAHLMYGLILFAILHNVVFQFFIIPHKKHWLLKPAILTVGDIMMGSMAVYVTGGVNSDFYVIYFLIAVLSAIRFGGSAAVISTAISIVLYTLVVFLHGYLYKDLSPLSDTAAILLRMGFVATTGVFVGYVGDKARQVELDLQVELEHAHAQLNESTALLNRNLEFKDVFQTASDQARLLMNAHFCLIIAAEQSAELLPHDLKTAYCRPYYSSSIQHDHVTNDQLLEIVSLFEDVFRLSPMLQHGIHKVDEEDDIVKTTDCTVEGTLSNLLGLRQGTLTHVVSVKLLSGEKEMGVLYMVIPRKRTEALKDTQINALRVFSTRISVAITNSLVFTQSKMQAVTDPVTGLYNHRFLHESITRELNRSLEERIPLSLIVLDIDSFKLFNDTYGHSVGDVALKSVADMIRTAVRGKGLAARFGGDEFVIILPGMTNPEACLIAESIRRKAVEFSHISTHEALSSLSISLGVATAPQAGETSEELFHTADLALYVAKHEGKNAVKSAEELNDYEFMLNSPRDLLSDTRFTKQDYSVETNRHSGLELQTINALVAAVDAKDHYTFSHSKEVSQWAGLLAAKMGMTTREVERIRVGALLHDVGKIGIPDVILQKDSRLTPEEYEVIKKHPVIGAQIIKPIKSLEIYLPIVMHHHEWYNGAGYPRGLAKEEIPLEARVVAICDAFDAMTSDRPYKRAMSHERALSTIRSLVGTQFDPDIWVVFEQMMMEKMVSATFGGGA